MNRHLLLGMALLLTTGTFVWSQTREEIVRSDKAKVEADGFWMYNDLPGAFAEAELTGKPICVVLRCLPCHECVKLDDDVVDTHPVIRPLLEQFVCVRQVATNGLDLNLFQYDTDQSFAMFFLNADKTIYGRFGTRSHRTEWVGDVSLTGLAEALQGALDLHKDFANVRSSLRGKTGQPLEVPRPELYPALKGKFTDKLDYEGDVVKSCIHCHQIGDAQREFYWHKNRPIPETVLWPYPHPKSIGLVLDPDQRSSVVEVTQDSPASKAGFKAGDEILSLAKQPMLSIADVQWVLHNVKPSGDQVPVTVLRDGKEQSLSLQLSDGWRKQGDLSWRVTTWGLRRIGGGGMVLSEVPEEERKALGLSDDEMALKVDRVGQYGAHATAKRSGVREGDVLTGYDGREDFMTEQDLLTYVVTEKRPGDKVTLNILRSGKAIELTLPVQR